LITAWFGLAAAFFWGSGDFSGGWGVTAVGGRLPGAVRVVMLSHATGLAALLAIVLLRRDAAPHGALIAWGILAGIAGGGGVVMFYIALARGAMGVSAAISGVLTAAIPAVVAIWVDGAPGMQKVAGFVVAGAAIWMIAAASGHEVPGTTGLAIASGAGFGVYFVALRFAGATGSIFWPMATSRMASVTLCGAMLFALRTRGGDGGNTLTRGAVGWAMGTALLDTTGNLFFLAAARAGRLDVAAVLASLYPVTTILLAAVALKEAPTRRQALGMGLAVVAVVLITV
jgi:drug/metabolite transporter (DMT)-like permease